MRVLVTGGAGFIGSHIVDQLIEHGHQAFVVDNFSTGNCGNLPPGVTVYEADICNPTELARVFDSVRPDAVCHQAAQISVSQSVHDPAHDAEVNVMGTIRVLENCARIGTKRIVFASSGGVLYGEVSSPATEDSPIKPISPYGIGKWTAERYLEFFASERGLRAIALRYSNVYGSRQNPHGEAGVIAIFSKKMLEREVILFKGDGSYVRDYVHVHDVARANVLSLETVSETPFNALNIGTSIGTSVLELVGMIRREAKHQLATYGEVREIPDFIYGPPRPGDLKSSLLNAQVAQRVLGWNPSIPLASGIRETVAWFATKVLGKKADRD